MQKLRPTKKEIRWSPFLLASPSKTRARATAECGQGDMDYQSALLKRKLTEGTDNVEKIIVKRKKLGGVEYFESTILDVQVQCIEATSVRLLRSKQVFKLGDHAVGIECADQEVARQILVQFHSRLVRNEFKLITE